MSVETYIADFLDNYRNYKDYWNYEDGCVLMGCQQLYLATKDEKYLDFILGYLDKLIDENGVITNYEVGKHNIDGFNAGKVLFLAYEKTGIEKYRKAVDYLINDLRQQPRTKEGNFFHKAIYPDQVWLDGLYMAQPFYMEYETKYNGKQNYNDIRSQFRNVRRIMFNKEKKLSYHGYDEARVQPWADKETGLSPNFWLRSMGWYLMAMIDVIDVMSEEMYEYYREMCDQFREALFGILEYRDPKSGLFFQVIDRSDVSGNYTETSGSAMVAYAVMKAARLDVISREKYAGLGTDIFDDLVKDKLRRSDDGEHLTDICWVAGLGPGDKRDGSVEYYLSEKIVSDDPKGVGPFMMAYAQKLLLSGGLYD
ncbi:MAG: glycoside hydrolase family 88 protein [Oscillospiraceae bacterium]|nr:glycoside hydrolase family 88 protein [Oscillospiraceae bacterium]